MLYWRNLLSLSSPSVIEFVTNPILTIVVVFLIHVSVSEHSVLVTESASFESILYEI
jgi:hypothetical protein